MKIKLLLSYTVLSFLSSFSYGQTIVRGIVTDGSNGDPIYSAIVEVDSVPRAKTDFEGAYSIELKEGTHTLTFTRDMDGYAPKSIVITVSGKGVEIRDINLLKSGTIGVDEIVFEVKGRNSNEGSLEERQEGNSTTDIVGQQEALTTGRNDAADIVSSTPGGSVDGNNVYIRGLGDRYTKSILNGMDIPGLDPDRNAVQMDIFPTMMINNVTVHKTFVPNLTGDFTGGLINIETVEFPARKTIYAKAGYGYNTNASFNSEFLTYESGMTDYFAFGNSSRKLPIHPGLKIPHPSSGDDLTTQLTSSFGKTMATEPGFAFLNQNYVLGVGNQMQIQSKKDSLKKWTYGYNAIVNYRSWNNYYDDVQFNAYRLDSDSSVNELFLDRGSRGELSTKDVMWTGLVGQSIKFQRNKISAVLFHTQAATSTATSQTSRNYDLNQATLVRQGLSYQQRSISNLNISGLHYLNESGDMKMTWNVSPTYSMIKDPDIRSTALEIADYSTPEDPIYLWEEAVGGEIRRIYRDLNEYNVSAKVDFTKSFEVVRGKDTLSSDIMFGALNTYKNRSYGITDYTFKLYNMSNEVPNDPNWFFLDENIWTVESGSGLYATGQQEPANQYVASQNISAIYAMNVLPISNSFDITYGARVERNVNRYTGISNNAATDPNAPRYDNEKVLDNINVLPSVNMVYKIRKEKDEKAGKLFDRNTNFRLAYTSTVARPSFREISISQIYDPIQGRRYLGNIELKQTTIHNADFRWEHFFGRGEVVSASAFYKRFINPIEVVANVAAPNEFKPVNAGQADVYGVELEIRKAIKLDENAGKILTVGTNFAYIISRIDMTQVFTVVGSDTLSEFSVRQANAREGQTINQYRTMYGQSPYIINAFLRYQDDSLGLVINASYNVQGPKLSVIGVGSVPDVYEMPFHSLNLKASKRLGKEVNGSQPWNLSITANNLLNFAKRRYYIGYEAEPQIFDYFHQGMTFSASISYSLK